MTFDEAAQLMPGDAVTRNGEIGTVESAVMTSDLKVRVSWASGRTGTVAFGDLKRA